MATAASLRRRIRSLESQIAELSSQQEETRRRIEQEQAQRIKSLRAQLKRESDQSRQQLEREFDRRSQQIREELFAQLQRQTEELRAFDAQAQRERQQLLDELQQMYDELSAELAGLKAQEQRRTEVSREMAEQLVAEAQQQQEAVEALPHAFFCAGQFDVFAEHLEQVQTFLAQGMCEAAASSADICLAELQILEINVRTMQREWEELYLEYRGQASMLHKLMEQFEAGPVESPLPPGAFILCPEDRDDWSSGQYGPVHDEIVQAFQLVQGVDGAGSVSAYLSEGEAPQGRQMVQAITGLHRLADRLLAAITCIRNEMSLSDGREMLAEQAERLLAEQGYWRVSGGYRNEDPLDSYVLDLKNNDMDTLRLTFVPVREDGVAVRNICLISLDIQTTPGESFIQQVAQETASIVKDASPGLQVVWDGVWDKSTADKVSQAESRNKDVPDMRLLVRRIERKYQE